MFPLFPGGSFQVQPMVRVRRRRHRKWDPGILWNIHKGQTAVVLGQSSPMWVCIHPTHTVRGVARDFGPPEYKMYLYYL